jgi:Ala-tRNA(Pro) deacylase
MSEENQLEITNKAQQDCFERICKYLDENNVKFRSVKHEPTFTSEESAKARGEDLSIGGKALLMKVDEKFCLFVLSASKKLNSKKLKQALKAKSLRFSTKEELFEMTKLVPGCVPPFGEPILPFKLYLDNSILANTKIAFNAGSLTNSIILDINDYLSVAKAETHDFTD